MVLLRNSKQLAWKPWGAADLVVTACSTKQLGWNSDEACKLNLSLAFTASHP